MKELTCAIAMATIYTSKQPLQGLGESEIRIQCLPGKMGLFERSSANMQPTDQTSTEMRGRFPDGIQNSHDHIVTTH